MLIYYTSFHVSNEGFMFQDEEVINILHAYAPPYPELNHSWCTLSWRMGFYEWQTEYDAASA